LEERLDTTIVVVSVMSWPMWTSVHWSTITKEGGGGHHGLDTVDRPEEFGVVGLDEDGRIVRFKRSPVQRRFSPTSSMLAYMSGARVLKEIPRGRSSISPSNCSPSCWRTVSLCTGCPSLDYGRT
jgi:hypothetical protein